MTVLNPSPSRLLEVVEKVTRELNLSEQVGASLHSLLQRATGQCPKGVLTGAVVMSRQDFNQIEHTAFVLGGAPQGEELVPHFDPVTPESTVGEVTMATAHRINPVFAAKKPLLVTAI